MSRRINKVALVGVGAVGASFAYAMVNQGTIEELVLIDVRREKAEGEVLDLQQGSSLTNSHTKISVGDYKDCGDADIVVITAGFPQLPGETRIDLVAKNAKIFKEMVGEIMASGFDGIFVIASNPVDIMAKLVWKYSGLPKERIIGSGTILDTARFRQMLGSYFDVDPRDVNAYIMGEHGDTSFPAWSHAYIGVEPVLSIVEKKGLDMAELDQIGVDVMRAAYEIINRKGATYYAIGLGLARIVRAIVRDENAVLTVGVNLEGEYGVNDMVVGVPAVINRDGIARVIELDLSDKEKDQMAFSYKALADVYNTLD